MLNPQALACKLYYYLQMAPMGKHPSDKPHKPNAQSSALSGFPLCAMLYASHRAVKSIKSASFSDSGPSAYRHLSPCGAGYKMLTCMAGKSANPWSSWIPGPVLGAGRKPHGVLSHVTAAKAWSPSELWLHCYSAFWFFLSLFLALQLKLTFSDPSSCLWPSGLSPGMFFWTELQE